MRLNELAIEKAVLETETVKSFRKLQERNRLDEVAFLAPWIAAAAVFVLRTVVFGGLTWLTEQTVGNFIDRWRRSNFVPNASFAPAGMELTVEDTSNNTRYSYRYNGTEWERPVLSPGPSGSLVTTGRWTTVPSSVNMQEVIEATARQRRWYDRLLGRRLRGIGFDWSNVPQDEMRRSIALTNMAARPAYAAASATEINEIYEREVQAAARENSDRARRARRAVMASSGLGLLVDLFTALGIVAWWYQARELIAIYDIQLEDGDITTQEYQEKVQTVRNSMKTLITGAVFNVGVAALAGAIGGLIGSRFTFLRNILGAASRWIQIGGSAVVTGVLMYAAFNDDVKSFIIDTLDTVWFLDNIELTSAIDNFLEELIDMMGLIDLFERYGREFDQQQLDGIGDLGTVPRGGVPSVGTFLWNN